MVNCDPEHCKGVWKPPPDKHVNRVSAHAMAGAVQRAMKGGKSNLNEPTPVGVGECHKVGRQHQANVREMRALQHRKMDEPRPATVPAMNVEQPFHVHQFFDRAAHHRNLAKGVRTERNGREKLDKRQHDDRTHRPGHTQHRTAVDIDARMDDVWGAMHRDRGVKGGQLAGSNYVDKPPSVPTRIYVGNLPQDASVAEVKTICGLRREDLLLQDPKKVEDKGLFTVDRTPKSNHAVITIRDRAMAQRVQNYCKSRPLKIRNHLLRVDIQAHGEANMYWTGIGDADHRPAIGDWCVEHKQGGANAFSGSRSKAGKGAAYSAYESEHCKQFGGGLMYDANGIGRYLKKHPAGSKAYPSVAEGRRRGAVKHGLMQWYPWMPAWDRGAPLPAIPWIPTPSFPGGGEPDQPMSDRRMRLAQRRPDEEPVE